MKHFNKLTPAEHERLALLLEEMGEAQQVVGKILRHGYEVGHPNRSTTNREDLEKELGDAWHAMQRLCEAGDVNFNAINDHADAKAESVERYLHHQPKRPIQ